MEHGQSSCGWMKPPGMPGPVRGSLKCFQPAPANLRRVDLVERVYLDLQALRVYEFVCFIGIGAAMQALLTPDAGILWIPHFRIFQIFIPSGLLLTSAIYMTAVQGFRPACKSFRRAVIGLNVHTPLMFPINLFWVQISCSSRQSPQQPVCLMGDFSTVG